MFPSTRSGWTTLALCVLGTFGACAVVEPMPTPIEQVRTTNETGPTFEHRPAPRADAGVADTPDAGAPAELIDEPTVEGGDH